jgi:hypothetical protein
MKRQAEAEGVVAVEAEAVVAVGCRHCRDRHLLHHCKFVHHKPPAILPMRGLPSLLRGISQL